MIDLKIDIGNLNVEFNLSKERVDDLLEYTVGEVAVDFARKWETEANNLVKSRDEYKNAIQLESIDQFTKVVFLNPSSWLANAVETGVESFDMKLGLLASPKAKINAEGKKYITIGFRFATAGSIGDNPLFAGVMPKAIQNLVQQNENENPEQQANSGLPFSKIPAQYQIPESSTLRKMMKSEAFTKLEQGTKMTSLYTGIKRNEKGSGYVMFRRVSENSADDKFIHPGIVARNFGQIAMGNMDIPFTIDVAIDTYLYSLRG